MSRIVHCYLCSHSEAEEVHDDGDTVHVFVEGPCNKSECLATDASWFTEGSSLPSDAELQLLKDLSEDWENVKICLNANLTISHSLDPGSRGALLSGLSITCGLIALVAHAADRGFIFGKYLHLYTAKQLLKYARDFSRDPKQKVFFDFCIREAQQIIYAAKDKTERFHRVINDFTRNRSTALNHVSNASNIPPTPTETCEPEFVIKDVSLLRLSQEGRRLLAQPFNERSIRRTKVLIHRTRKELGLPSTLTSKGASSSLESIEALRALFEKTSVTFRAQMGARLLQSRASTGLVLTTYAGLRRGKKLRASCS